MSDTGAKNNHKNYKTEKRNVVALFDFDHTLTTSDTFIGFTIFCFGRTRIYLWFLLHLPMLILMAIGIVSITTIKELFFGKFFSGMDYEKYLERSREYAKKIEMLIRPEALTRMQWHIASNHLVIIISASFEDWIRPWANIFLIKDIIASQPEVIGNKLTGKLKRKNCSGKEKVVRLFDKYPNITKNIIYAYGDSAGDSRMLELADYAFFRKFN
jgi:phosphatidylglycerophosphatase C